MMGITGATPVQSSPNCTVRVNEIGIWCNENGGVSGNATISSQGDGDWVGSITFFLTYHVPGSQDWIPTGDQYVWSGTVPNNGQITINFSMGMSVPLGANSMRIENNNDTTKSISIPPCPGDPTPTPTNTLTPTATFTSTPTDTPTNTPTPTATATNTPTVTLTSTATNTPSPTSTGTLVPTDTPTMTPTPTNTKTPTPTPTRTVSPTPTPTETVSPTPTETPTKTPTETPVITPTETPKPPKPADANDSKAAQLGDPIAVVHMDDRDFELYKGVAGLDGVLALPTKSKGASLYQGTIWVHRLWNSGWLHINKGDVITITETDGAVITYQVEEAVQVPYGTYMSSVGKYSYIATCYSGDQGWAGVIFYRLKLASVHLKFET